MTPASQIDIVEPFQKLSHRSSTSCEGILFFIIPFINLISKIPEKRLKVISFILTHLYYIYLIIGRRLWYIPNKKSVCVPHDNVCAMTSTVKRLVKLNI